MAKKIVSKLISRYGKTITLKHRSKTGTNKYGEETYDTVEYVFEVYSEPIRLSETQGIHKKTTETDVGEYLRVYYTDTSIPVELHDKLVIDGVEYEVIYKTNSFDVFVLIAKRL